jgi:hypothetical protein
MIGSEVFYRPKDAPPALPLQGDIFKLVPSVYIDGRPLEVIRTYTATGGTIGARIHQEEIEPPSDGFRWDDERILARGSRTFGVLLSHDCEIEHEHKHRILGLVRPWDRLPVKSQADVLSGAHYCFYHLWASPERQFPESYVDFRRLTTVRPQVLKEEDRIMSMTDHARNGLAEAFLRYVTRVVL